MKKRKSTLIFLLAVVMAMVFGLVACENAPEKKSIISLDKKEFILDRYESKLLVPTVTVEGTAVVWSTSDASVASVTDGLVEACGEGKATITATAAGDSATCEVTIVDSGLLPSISVNIAPITLHLGETSQLKAKAVYKGIDVTATLTYSSSRPEIATVSETGLITVVRATLSDNLSVITIGGTYRGYAMTAKTVDVTTAVVPKDKAEYAFNLDSGKETVTATLNAGITGIVTIKDEATKAIVFTSAEGQTVTFNKANLTIGERFFLIETAGDVYRVPVIVATQIINNKAEFTTYMKLMNDRSGPVGDGQQHSDREYYLLAADIDCAGEVYTRWISWGSFNGVFNGGNHVISNMAVPQDGMFRIARGTIKNFALVNATYSTGAGGFIVGEFYGTIENIFVQGKVTAAVPVGGIANNIRNGAVIKNCVAIVEYTNAAVTVDKPGGIVRNFNNTKGSSVINCFSVNNVATETVGDMGSGTNTITNCQHFATAVALAEAIKNKGDLLDDCAVAKAYLNKLDIKITNASNIFAGENLTLQSTVDSFVTWSIVGEAHGTTVSGNILTSDAKLAATKTITVRATSIFNSKSFADKVITIVAKPIVDKAEYAFNLDLEKETVTATLNAGITGIITIKDEATKAIVFTSVDGQTVTFNKANLTVGERFFLIETAEEIYRVPVIVATKIIKTTAEFLAIRTGTANFAGQYFLLNNDLDFTGVTVPQGGTTDFTATLNGNGFAVKNIAVPSEGIFRIFAGKLKDMAVIDGTFSGAGCIAGWIRNGAEIRNVYVLSKTSSNGGFGGIVNEIRDGSVKIVNCVAVFEAASGTLKGTKGGIVSTTYKDADGATINNCFSVSSIASNVVGTNNGKNTNLTGSAHFATAVALAEAIKNKGDLLDDCAVAKAYLNKLDIKITNASNIFAGENLTLQSTVDSFVTWSIVGEAHGATVSGNILTSDATLTETKTITVRATSIFNSKSFADKVITIVAKPIVDKAEYAFNLELGKETVTATLNAGIAGIITIKDEATKAIVFTSVDGQTVTFNKANLTAGERFFLIEVAEEIYRVPVIVATQIINNKTEFTAYMKLMNDRSGPVNAGKPHSDGEYFLLAADIDCAGEVYTRWISWGSFNGVFNGGNHVISNMAVPQDGMFRIARGTIKNFALVNATYSTGAGGFIVGEFYGTIENIFVQGKVTAAVSVGGIANSIRNGAVIKNCVAVVEYTNAAVKVDKPGGIVRNFNNTKGSSVINCFSVNNVATETVGDMGSGTNTITNCQHFATAVALAESIKNKGDLLDDCAVSKAYLNKFDIKITNASNIFAGENLTLQSTVDSFVTWSIVGEAHGTTVSGNILTSDSKLAATKTITVRATSIFNSKSYVDKVITIVAKPIVDKAEYAFNLDSGKETVTATLNAGITGILTIKDEATKASVFTSVDGQTVTFNKANLTIGERFFLIETAGDVYRVPVIVATQIIKTTAEFLAIRTGTANFVGQYFLLNNDLDFTGVTVPQGGTTGFTATLNGNGFAVKNIAVPSEGIFRIFEGKLKDMAVIDGTFSGAGCIAGWIRNGAEIRNVYVLSKTSSNGGFGGIANEIRDGSVKIVNCVAVFEAASGTLKGTKGGIASATYKDANGATINNCFSVSSIASNVVGTNNGKNTNLTGSAHFADVAALKIALETNTTLFDVITTGNTVWKIVGTTLTFNNIVVFDWTAK